MKKILALIMISAACIVAVACGEEPDDASITKSVEAVTTTTAVATTTITTSTTTEISTSTTVTTTEQTTTTVQEETTTAPPETTTAAPPETTVITTTVPEVTTIPESTEHGYDFVLNNNTIKAHVPNCSSVKDIKEGNSSEFTGTISDLESMGYAPCGKCKPW